MKKYIATFLVLLAIVISISSHVTSAGAVKALPTPTPSPTRIPTPSITPPGLYCDPLEEWCTGG